VALNVVFAATYAIYKLPLFAGEHQPAAPKGPLYLQLDLTSDQLRQFSAERDRFHAQLLDLGKKIKTEQIELIDLLGAAAPNQQAIERKQEEIQHLQADVQKRVIDHFLQAGGFLTSEQRIRFFELIKGRIETNAQACTHFKTDEWVSK
jgi:Spy/CpxP family protein refolding chaperone